MDLFRVCLPCSADGMQVAGKDIELVAPPSPVACIKVLAHSLLQSARSAFSANYSLFFFDATAPQWVRDSSFTSILDHTQRRTTVGETPLDE
jgi:hypothetical protein